MYLRIRLEQLRDRDRRIAERRRARDGAEVRIRHALQQRRALRELLDGQLIQVRVGNADAGDLRADVGHLDRDVRRELALHRRVPLLDVARSEIAIDGEHALPEAGVRRQRNRRRRSVRWRAMNAGVMLSSVRCDTVCRNGKTGVVNGVVMPAISIHTSAVAGPHDGLVGDAADDAEARAEVELVQLRARRAAGRPGRDTRAAGSRG